MTSRFMEQRICERIHQRMEYHSCKLCQLHDMNNKATFDLVIEGVKELPREVWLQ